MIKNVSVEEFWNGINIGDYEIDLVMDKACLTMEHIGKITTFDDFKYRDLPDKLNGYFNKYNKILLNIPYGDIKRRFKTLTEKLGYKIERTTYYDENSENHERIYVVITR